jgi:hypothetical protein
VTQPHVTADQLVEYLNVFHHAYRESVRSFLPKPLHDSLLRQALSEHHIYGFVSTQFGAGYEYTGEGQPAISVKVASRRVEYIFLDDAPASVRKLPSMLAVGGHDTGIMYLTLEGGFPFRLTAPDASIRFVEVGFRVPPWDRVVRLAELFADRTATFWSPANAAMRGVQAARADADVATLDVETSNRIGVSLSQFIKEFKAKTVLVLGDYHDEGAERLEAIRAALLRFGYQPVLVKEVPEQPHHDLQQKLVAIASVARFIVIDDSSVSGHLVEFPLVQSNRWVTLVLRLSGSTGSFMTHGASVASSVIRESTYNKMTLDSELLDGIQWAEQKLKELERDLGGAYPWRSDVPEQ